MTPTHLRDHLKMGALIRRISDNKFFRVTRQMDQYNLHIADPEKQLGEGEYLTSYDKIAELFEVLYWGQDYTPSKTSLFINDVWKRRFEWDQTRVSIVATLNGEWVELRTGNGYFVSRRIHDFFREFEPT